MEKVVTPVIDFALTLPGVDAEKIALNRVPEREQKPHFRASLPRVPNQKCRRKFAGRSEPWNELLASQGGSRKSHSRSRI
jgi:hypothetical protein